MAQIDFEEWWQRLQDLDADDLQNVGSAPIGVKWLLIVLSVFLAVVLGLWFIIMPMFERLEKDEKTEQELRGQFDVLQAQAVNLGAYKEQLEEIELLFGAMLSQLPDTTEIENLLIDISQATVSSGLEIVSFQPEQEVAKEFYAELAISILVSGSYHKFGDFVSTVAALPRIVTLRNVSIKPSQKNQGEGDTLEMQMTAVTYRYVRE